MRPTLRPQPLRTVAALVVVAAALAGCGRGGGSTAPDPVEASDVAASSSIPPVEAPPVSDRASTTLDAATSGVPSDPITPEPVTPEPIAPEPITTEPASESTAADDAPAEPSAGFRGVSLVDELVVFDSPEGAEVATLPATTPFGTPTVVHVVDRAPGWVQVLVPVRPNDLRGWVRAADVRLEGVDAEIHIDLDDRTLRLTEDGEPAGEWTVAIGRTDRPTPVGTFFITDKLATGDPDSVWGSHAFGVSAYSDVLTDFIGGIGQIGIHGTNDPGSIGIAVSSGCIRLPNEVIDDLITRLSVGTPVHIV